MSLTPRTDPDDLREPEDLDAANAAAAARGDARAFEHLYERYFPVVFRFASGRLGERAEAEDVTQEVFLVVFRGLDGYGARGSFGSWLFGIARNVIAARQRSRWRREARERSSMETAPSPTTPEEEARGSHVLAAIDSELRRLEPWQAEAVELHCMRGVSQQEVARRIDRSRYAVRMSVNRLRRVVEKRIA